MKGSILNAVWYDHLNPEGFRSVLSVDSQHQMFRSLTDSPSSGWSLFQVAPLVIAFSLSPSKDSLWGKRLSWHSLYSRLIVMMITGWLANSDHQSVNIVFLVDSVIHPPCHSTDGQSNHSSPWGEEILYILDQKSVRWEGRDSLWQTVSLGLGSSNAISEMSHHNIIISPGLPPFQF